MKRLIAALLLFVVSLAVFLVAGLPARIALRYLPPDVPVQVIAPSGTVWRGAAAELRWRGEPLGALSWRLQVLPLLLGRLRAHVALEGDGLRARGLVTLRPDRSVTVRDALADADLASLPLDDLHLLAEPAGHLQAVVRELTLNGGHPRSADADLLWQPARLTSPVAYDLGGLALKLRGKKGRLTGDLSSRGGPVDARGTLQLDPNGNLDVNVKLTPRPDAPQDLRDLLAMLGRPGRDGSVRLRQRLPLPGW